MTKASIFISYRRLDTKWAAVALRHHITRDFPDAEVFMDITSIEPGEDFVAAIHKRVDCCQVLLAIIGPNWLGISDNSGRRRLDDPNDFVRIEILRALERGIRVVPILVDDAPMPAAAALPDVLVPLATRNAITIGESSNDRDFDALCDFLARHLKIVKARYLSLEHQPTTAPNSKPIPTEQSENEVGKLVAQALLDVGTDPKTMVGVADMRRDKGRVDVEAAIRVAAMPALIEAEGPDSIWVLANRFNLANALINLGQAAQAEAELVGLLPIMERVRSVGQPATFATRHILARAALEQGAAERAREALAFLPPFDEDTDPSSHARAAMLSGWLADLDGDGEVATRLFKKAAGFLADLPADYFMHRDLARYLETRVPGGSGGTMIPAQS